MISDKVKKDIARIVEIQNKNEAIIKSMKQTQNQLKDAELLRSKPGGWLKPSSKYANFKLGKWIKS